MMISRPLTSAAAHAFSLASWACCSSILYFLASPSTTDCTRRASASSFFASEQVCSSSAWARFFSARARFAAPQNMGLLSPVCRPDLQHGALRDTPPANASVAPDTAIGSGVALHAYRAVSPQHINRLPGPLGLRLSRLQRPAAPPVRTRSLTSASCRAGSTATVRSRASRILTAGLQGGARPAPDA